MSNKVCGNLSQITSELMASEKQTIFTIPYDHMGFSEKPAEYSKHLRYSKHYLIHRSVVFSWNYKSK